MATVFSRPFLIIIMANLNKIVKIKQKDYSTLISAGSVTIDGVTYNYDANNLYVV